jgi:hypothetical protein
MANRLHDENQPLISGNHLKSSPNVPEGGPADAPTDGGHGHKKPALSTAEQAGVSTEGTSHATAGKREQELAATIGANKHNQGRGRRKED